MKQHMIKIAKALIAFAPMLALSGLTSFYFFGEAKIPESLLKE